MSTDREKRAKLWVVFTREGVVVTGEPGPRAIGPFASEREAREYAVRSQE